MHDDGVKRDAAFAPGLIIFSHVVRLDVVVMCPGKGVAPCAPQLLRSSSFALLLALPRFPSVDLEAFPPYPLLLPIFGLLPPSQKLLLPFSLDTSLVAQFFLLAVALRFPCFRRIYGILALSVVLALLVGRHLRREVIYLSFPSRRGRRAPSSFSLLHLPSSFRGGVVPLRSLEVGLLLGGLGLGLFRWGRSVRRRWSSTRRRPRCGLRRCGRRPHAPRSRGQVRVRLVDLLEALGGFLDVRGIPIGVVHEGELAERFFYGGVVGRVRQAQGLQVLGARGRRHLIQTFPARARLLWVNRASGRRRRAELPL